MAVNLDHQKTEANAWFRYTQKVTKGWTSTYQNAGVKLPSTKNFEKRERASMLAKMVITLW